MDIVPDAETDMDLSDIVSKMPAKKKRKLTTESLNKDFDKKSNDSKSEKSKDSDSVSEGRLEIKLEKEEENSLESLANKSNAELLENEKNKTANDRKLEKNVENALIIPKEEPIDVDAEDEKTKE